MKKLICLLLCLCLCGCAAPKEESRDSVTVWYILGQEPEGLEELVNEYNKTRAEGTLPVSLRAFAHEQSLAAAFEQVRPDLLFCRHGKAEELNSAGLLRSVSVSMPDYSEGILKSIDYAGESFFPIGTELQLLVETEAVFNSEALESIDAFCTSAADYSLKNKSAAFTADDFAALFCHALLGAEREFHADISTDKNDELFKYLYNLLTECAMDGGLLAAEYSAADIVKSRALPYAMVNSSSIAGMTDVNVYPLPALKSSLLYPGQCLGFAVTAAAGRETGSIENFLNYVNQPERGSRLALGQGLAPALLSDIQGNSSLEHCLLEIGAYYEPYLPSDSSDYMKNRLSFEAVFRNTINRLY